MKNVLIIILSLSSTFAICQTNRKSTINLRYFVNEKEKSITNSSIYIVVEKDTINGLKISETKFEFPFINGKYDTTIHIDNSVFNFGSFEDFSLNFNTEIVIGKINRIKVLQSVAESNGINESDTDWKAYYKRYFLANKMYTIDLEDISKIKKLEYIVLNAKIDSSESRNGQIIVSHRITKSK